MLTKPKPVATLNPTLKPFWQARADVKVLKGGRASSKTWDAAGFAVFLAARYTVKFLCMRQHQNKIAESVKSVIEVQIERFGLLDEFEILKSTIKHRTTGSEFHFYGIARDIEEIKGFEGADIGWIEEAQALTKEQWLIIEPTLRKEGAQAWLIYNPYLVTDFVETFFKHDPANGVIVRHINYDENPFLSETMLRKIERMRALDEDDYNHVYLGQPLTNDEAVIIKRSWVEASIDAHITLGIEPAGRHRVGFDIADDGDDLNALNHSHGIVNFWGENWKGGEDELLQSCTRAYNYALQQGASIDYDSVGVGASAGSKFKELNDARLEKALSGKVAFRKFVAGAKVIDPDGFYLYADGESMTNRDMFSDLTAQAWWYVADRFRNTYCAIHYGEQFKDEELISISSDHPMKDALIDQLSAPRRTFDRFSRVKRESKDDMRGRGIASPNDADAFIMSNAPIAVSAQSELLKLAVGTG